MIGNFSFCFFLAIRTSKPDKNIPLGNHQKKLREKHKTFLKRIRRKIKKNVAYKIQTISCSQGL